VLLFFALGCALCEKRARGQKKPSCCPRGEITIFAINKIAQLKENRK
jgi:hypothetical protein